MLNLKSFSLKLSMYEITGSENCSEQTLHKVIDLENSSYKTFYEEIFSYKQDGNKARKKYYQRIEQIMTTAGSYEDEIIFAAADYARTMTTADNLIEFYRFCAYFEFAFTEFEIIIKTYKTNRRNPRQYSGRQCKCASPKDCLMKHHFNGNPLTLTNDSFIRLISNDAVEELRQKYKKYESIAFDIGLVPQNEQLRSENKPKINEIHNIVSMAKDKKIKFKNLPIAVYHWRKHASFLKKII